MYQIIKDLNLACQYRDAGLLWWVSYESGGEAPGICHLQTTVGHQTIRDNITRGCFGICVEE